MFAAPRGLSQRTTSFIASQRQGIHQMLLRHLITLTIHARSAADTNHQRKTCLSDFSKRHVLLAKHIRRSTAAGRQLVRGTRLPACRICCLFTISNIRATHPRRAGHEPHLTFRRRSWWSLSGSNRRPEACKATALPAELRPPLGRPQAPAKASAFLASRATRRGGRSAFARRTTVSEATDKMVGLGRLERPTSPLSGVRSNHLSYRPDPPSKRVPEKKKRRRQRPAKRV